MGDEWIEVMGEEGTEHDIRRERRGKREGGKESGVIIRRSDDGLMME